MQGAGGGNLASGMRPDQKLPSKGVKEDGVKILPCIGRGHHWHPVPPIRRSHRCHRPILVTAHGVRAHRIGEGGGGGSFGGHGWDSATMTRALHKTNRGAKGRHHNRHPCYQVRLGCGSITQHCMCTEYSDRSSFETCLLVRRRRDCRVHVPYVMSNLKKM